LADVRTREIPAVEARHKDALARNASEVARLKHALKEAEQAAAAAQQAAAAAGQEGLQQLLQETIQERERCGSGMLSCVLQLMMWILVC
jgi:hypothetical protein